jgi:hypothetical protein
MCVPINTLHTGDSIFTYNNNNNNNNNNNSDKGTTDKMCIERCTHIVGPTNVEV